MLHGRATTTSEHKSIASTREPLLPSRATHAETRLLTYGETPPWYGDNHYIHSGYRPITQSCRACILSLGRLHNETVNIYSHLLPALLAIIGGAVSDRVFVSAYPLASVTDRVVLAFCFLTIMTGMGLSASYHTLMNHSAEYSELWGRIDYCGIMVLTFGDFFTGIYVGFSCEPLIRRRYLVLISILTAVTALVVLSPSFRSRQYRLLRLCCFIATGLSTCAPVVHALRLFPAEQMHSRLYYYCIECGIILAAVVIYATRFPEVWRPGKHDIWGASHQLFHVLTVLATAVHGVAVWSAYDYNYVYRRC